MRNCAFYIRCGFGLWLLHVLMTQIGRDSREVAKQLILRAARPCGEVEFA